MAKRKSIRATKDGRPLLAMSADVTIKAAEGENGKPTFSVVAYTGGAIEIAGWDQPVVVDLDGMTFGRSLVANLDHDSSKRVGHVTSKSIDGGRLVLEGVASAATPARDEVIQSAVDGFVWEASIEARPREVSEVPAREKVEANGQSFAGPLYLVRTSTLKGFAFVSHGADDNTTVSIAAIAAHSAEKGNIMDPELKRWIEAIGFVADDLTEEQLDGLKANYESRNAPKKPAVKAANPFEERKAEAKRRRELREVADRHLELRSPDEEEIVAVEQMYDHAVETKMTVQEFRLGLYEASVPPGHTVIHTPKERGLTSSVIEAAVCMAGRLDGHEKMFDDRTLQTARDRFRSGIGLKQLFLLCAEQNGYRANYSSDVTIDAQRAAFGMTAPNRVQAAWSTLDISTILSNVANKFLREGWMSVDQTPMEIAAIRAVRDFKTVTTVSLTGDLQYAQVGPGGEIPHGTLGEEVYTNKADTYARMLAITRTDIINDDLGALTAVPRRLGRGAMLLLNHIFWTEFLNNGAFFVSTNSNHNEAVASMTVLGLAATELIFMSQTDPDGKPLGIQPEILLVPTALKPAALALMSSERLIDGTATATQGDANIWRGRFRVLSSPYMHNTAYTGYSAAAWYMLASPSVMPVIEIAALNGRVEPTIETADADFNVLGVQMRGYSDVGVNLQEYRGGVRADGGDS